MATVEAPEVAAVRKRMVKAVAQGPGCRPTEPTEALGGTRASVLGLTTLGPVAAMEGRAPGFATMGPATVAAHLAPAEFAEMVGLAAVAVSSVATEGPR